MDWFLYDKDLRHERVNIYHSQFKWDSEYVRELKVKGSFRVLSNIYDEAFLLFLLLAVIYFYKKLHHRCLKGPKYASESVTYNIANETYCCCFWHQKLAWQLDLCCWLWEIADKATGFF